MKFLTLCAAVCLTSHSARLFADEGVESLRDTVKQWVDVEKSISAESAAWAEKEILLKDLIAVEGKNIEKLENALREFDSNATAADAARKKLVEERESLDAQRSAIREFLDTTEPQLKTLKLQLPAPLEKRLEPFFIRLPNDPTKTSLGLAERMQTVVGILSTIQKFDRVITVTDEIKTLEDGSQGEVQTVYIGLGAAYYRSRSAADAGIGQASPTGWKWTSQPELGSAIAEVIAIAQNTSQEARFISLPVELQN
ncbi:MAG: DUF3450 family protein [Verrucomicrobiota bacterium]